MLLAGDVGGTSLRLALIDPEQGPRHVVAHAQYHSADFNGLEAAVEAFVSGSPATPDHACFSVAGPVMDGRAHLTNLTWDLDHIAIEQACGLRHVDLLNDIACMAHAAPHLLPDEVEVIKPGRAAERGPLAIIAPGTGLGEAFLIWGPAGYVACPSEGGHGDFAPVDALQAELWAYLRRDHPHVSVERVCSGSGIPQVYEFLCGMDPSAETSEFRSALAGAPDRAPLIVAAGLDEPLHYPLAHQTLRLFCDVLAAEAGNLALRVLATGGVLLGGGLPPRIMPLLKDQGFARAFTGKGRFAHFLEATPVSVVTTNAALLGAAIYGLAARAAT